MAIRRWPSHISGYQRRALVRWANTVRRVHGYRVYLCGSALTTASPRDWDIRCLVSDATFAQRFGAVGSWEYEGRTGRWGLIRARWSDVCVQLSKQGYRRTGLNVDCQIYPASHARRVYAGAPRFKLDGAVVLHERPMPHGAHVVIAAAMALAV
jgi:hypothetical protein